MPTLISFPGIALAVPGLVHGVTERSGGVSLGPYASPQPGTVLRRRPRRGHGERPSPARAPGGRTSPFASPTRSTGVTSPSSTTHVDGPVGPADAVITSVPGRAVGVLGADCPGVLVVDPVRRVVAVVHSGWRGTVAGVLPAVLAALGAPVRLRGPRPPRRHRARDLRGGATRSGRTWRSPSRPPSPRGDAPASSRAAGDRSFLDLADALRRQALDAGVPDASIETSPLCTFAERDRLFSHRRDGARTGRHALVAMWARGAAEGTAS